MLELWKSLNPHAKTIITIIGLLISGAIIALFPILLLIIFGLVVAAMLYAGIYDVFGGFD